MNRYIQVVLLLSVKWIMCSGGATDHLGWKRVKVCEWAVFSGIDTWHCFCWARLECWTLFLRTPRKTKDMSTVSLVFFVCWKNSSLSMRITHDILQTASSSLSIMQHISRRQFTDTLKYWCLKICIFITPSHVMADNVVIYANQIIACVYIQVRIDVCMGRESLCTITDREGISCEWFLF